MSSELRDVRHMHGQQPFVALDANRIARKYGELHDRW